MIQRWLPRLLCATLCASLVLSLFPCAQAAETEAADLSSPECVTGQEGIPSADSLFDGNTTQALSIPEGARLTLSHSQGIGSLYLIFDVECSPYTVTNNTTGESQTFGTQGFLHEYLDLREAFGAVPISVTITFGAGKTLLNELSLFSPGKVPSYIQKWDAPREGKTDLILFATHGDDEQLFFAGMLPYYAGEKGYEVLVVYLTDHRNTGTLRCHEMLNGLWAVGVTTYPVFGRFGDYYSRSKSSAYALHRNAGETRDALLGFVVEQLRRYKPQVAVGHDPTGGEYGHGQHRMYGELLSLAVTAAGDPQACTETAGLYGLWDVPKTYLHLWPENQIVLNWDQPLDRFSGMTAFQVTQELGFPCHKSQYWGFAWYIANYARAADIPRYSPCRFGLYRTTVGPDTGKGDLFENLTAYSQQDRESAARSLKSRVIQLKDALRRTLSTGLPQPAPKTAAS